MTADARRSAPMSCAEFVELVTDYLEGRLPVVDRGRFLEHIAECPDCPRYLRQIEETIRITGRLTDESLTPTMRDTLLEAFRGWRAGGPGGG